MASVSIASATSVSTSENPVSLPGAVGVGRILSVRHPLGYRCLDGEARLRVARRPRAPDDAYHDERLPCIRRGTARKRKKRHSLDGIFNGYLRRRKRYPGERISVDTLYDLSFTQLELNRCVAEAGTLELERIAGALLRGRRPEPDEIVAPYAYFPRHAFKGEVEIIHPRFRRLRLAVEVDDRKQGAYGDKHHDGENTERHEHLDERKPPGTDSTHALKIIFHEPLPCWIEICPLCCTLT